MSGSSVISRQSPIQTSPMGMSPNQRPSTAERLTPLPDYMSPISKSPQRKFKKLHDDHMMGKLMEKRVAKKQLNQSTRDQARSIMIKIPTELLAKEWMLNIPTTVETRAYLLDKVLPTLILGMEKVLMQAEKRGLTENSDADRNFNPINFLAQYLMRNNPKYSNFSEASPYIRGLREISETLKTQLFDIEENKLARIKMEARKKREQREKELQAVEAESKRRDDVIKLQFVEWNVGLYPEGRVKLALLQNALRSFAELNGAQFAAQLEPTDDSGKMVMLKDFVLYLKKYIDSLSKPVFDDFMAHMSQCARLYRSQAEREQRKAVLTQVFASCDHTGVGILDRHRILDLFAMFYDKAQKPIKEGLRNPRRWPVVDHEYEVLSDEDDESTLPGRATTQTQHTAPPDQQQSKEAEAPAEVSEETKEEVAKPEEGAPAADAPADVAPAADGAAEETAHENHVVAAPSDEKSGSAGTAAVPSISIESEDDAKTENAQTKEKEVKLDPVKEEAETEKAPESPKEVKKDAVKKDATEKQDTQKEVADVQKEAKEQKEEKKSDKKEAPPQPKKEKTEEEEKPQLMTEVSDVSLLKSAPLSTEKSSSDYTSGDGAGDSSDDKAQGESGQESGGSAGIQQPSRVSFADGTAFKRERTLLSQNTRSHSAASVYDEHSLNPQQFLLVTETFMGELPDMEAFQHLVRYLRDGYVETEEERRARIIKARAEQDAMKRKALLNSLFEMWDNDGSGFLDMDEVETVMKKYKDGMDNQHIDKAKKDIRKRSKYHDSRLSKREFRDFVYKIVELMGGNENFDYFVEFLLNSVERTYQERVRGEARKKWLAQVIKAGETGGAAMAPVYKAVFSGLYKDAEAHGNGKVISAYIGLLERNEVEPERGDVLLRYTATTSDNAHLMLNKVLHKDMKGISFAAVESGKPIHVPRVNNHGNIMFWRDYREGTHTTSTTTAAQQAKEAGQQQEEEEKDGSVIVVPLKDHRKRVFGLLGIDTLSDPKPRSIFITHEIQFFQGVAKAFSIAYHHVDNRQKTMRISESAISWIYRRSPHVTDLVVYMVEPDAKSNPTAPADAPADFVLRRMMATDHKGMAAIVPNPPRLQRKDNLFKDYLFKCVDTSESIAADAYGDRHLAIPLRDDDGRAIVVIDITIGPDLKALPKAESREVMKMLKLLQTAYKQISREARDGEKPPGLLGEGEEEEIRAEVLFDRLMMMELKENVSKLDATAYAELKSYKEPPPVVHQILKAVLAMFYVDKANSGEFDDWDRCKKYVGPKISAKIMELDPTNDNSDHIPVELINGYLEQVPHGAVAKQGSLPSQYLYNWVFVCVSLIEHTRKTKSKGSGGLKKPEQKKSESTQEKEKETSPPAEAPKQEAAAEVPPTDGQQKEQ